MKCQEWAHHHTDIALHAGKDKVDCSHQFPLYCPLYKDKVSYNDKVKEFWQ